MNNEQTPQICNTQQTMINQQPRRYTKHKTAQQTTHNEQQTQHNTQLHNITNYMQQTTTNNPQPMANNQQTTK